jgi:hypothetical protein
MKKNKPAVPIKNFRPVVLFLIRKHNSGDAEPELWVRLKLAFDDGQVSNEFVALISELDSLEWTSKDFRCRPNPEIAPAKVRRHLANEVRIKLPDAEIVDVYYIDRLGTHVIHGIPFFNAGNQLIFPQGVEVKPNIELAPMKYRMAIDPNITEAEAVAKMLEFLSLSTDPMRIVLSQKLLYIKRHVYKNAWKSPCVIVHLNGGTGNKKTSTANLMT